MEFEFKSLFQAKCQNLTTNKEVLKKIYFLTFANLGYNY